MHKTYSIHTGSLACVFFAGIALALMVFSGAAHARIFIVSSKGEFRSIEDAIHSARDGDVIEVHGGVYREALNVTKTIHVLGKNSPVIDGKGKGTVVTLAKKGIVFSGFKVQNSGDQPDGNDAGITVTAPHVVVENNRLENVLFGILLQGAKGSVVRKNYVTGMEKLGMGRKGDGIKLWYSHGAVISDNTVEHTRDVVVWYSPRTVLKRNYVKNGRYGIHIMYADFVRLEGNYILNNSVGVYAMYSQNFTISGNVIRGQMGVSGYALGFKDANNFEVKNNVIVDNRGGVFSDSSPYNADGYGRFTENIFAFNDTGVILLPSARGNTFTGNTFWENTEQVSIQGGGEAPKNMWEGNFWSDYKGFDLNSDGQGDLPYASERYFENLMDRQPLLRVLIYSPVVHAIELAAASFPVVRPQPKLRDEKPAAVPARVPSSAILLPGQNSFKLYIVSISFLILSCFVLIFAYIPLKYKIKGTVH